MAKFVRNEGQDHGMIDAHQHSPSNWIKKGMKCIYTSPFHRGLCKIVASQLADLRRMVKSLLSCFAPIARGFLGASRSIWYFDLVRILETC